MINDNNNYCWFLLGPTGIGKTFVSLRIGQKFNNQIINTDAFSLYKEASIMTAKATKKEMSLVHHRMINILDLFDINYHQKLFKKDALNEINSIIQNGQTPLIVGGTNYFVESILFNYENEDILENNNEINNNDNPIELLEKNEYIKNLKINDKNYLNENFNEKNNNKKELIKILSIIDEKSSNFYNDNDIRRIINSISFYISYNKKKSDMLNNQIIKLNFEKNKIIILLPSNIDDLLKRIISRIDEMIEEGLSEIIYIFNKFILNKKEINFEVGVLQSIGYKEFYELYQNLNSNLINDIYNTHLKAIMDDNDEQLKEFNKNILENIIYKDEKLKNIFDNCRQKLINNTLNYAKYQIKFIKKRIMPYITRYKIVEIKDFKKEIYINEYIPQIVNYLNNNEFISIINNDKNKIEDWKRYYCDICKCELNGDNNYNLHMKSNKHKKQKDKLRKKLKAQKPVVKHDDVNDINEKLSKISISNSNPDNL